MPASRRPLLLVLGATGYVGGRLVPRLVREGYRVRCLVRTPSKVAALAEMDRVEVVKGDLLDGDSLTEAFDGVDGVYHLVHSMGMAEEFAAADRRIARNVVRAAEHAGVQRLVYLGGLGEVDGRTSPHLRSRAEVGEILTSGNVACTTLRAAVIIGSGSASFEMLRHLTEKLPFMVTPRWVSTRTQPIAVRDVLRYLLAVLDLDDDADHLYDIGGPDVLTYLDMMQMYARIAGLPRRVVLTVPVLTPKLSSHWVHLVTPVPFGLAQPLVLSLASEVVVRVGAVGAGGLVVEDIAAVAPGPALGYEDALRLAVARIRDHEVETSWRDAELEGRSPAEPYPGDPEWSGGTLLQDVRTSVAACTPDHVFAAVSGIGGGRGWPTYMWAWQVRGLLDLAVGGVGLRRGRRDPDRLRVGDALDFWRVEDVRPGEMVRLRAEMKLPGRAWLEFRMRAAGEPGQPATELTQRALFAPKGLFGRLYWWTLAPFHGFIFGSMVQALAREAERLARAERTGRLTSSDALTAVDEAPDGPGGLPGPGTPPRRTAG